jgi:hypothetical protein
LASARPDQEEQTCRYVDITGHAATVRFELCRDGVHTFTDYLSLYKCADGWKIVSKTFYTHPQPK